VQSIVGSRWARADLAIALLLLRARWKDGGGDVKLMAMIGAFPLADGFAVLLAALPGAYGVILLKRSGADGKTAVAFGFFLAPAATFMWFAGERLMARILIALTQIMHRAHRSLHARRQPPFRALLDHPPPITPSP
jgi:hypothetical protein